MSGPLGDFAGSRPARGGMGLGSTQADGKNTPTAAPTDPKLKAEQVNPGAVPSMKLLVPLPGVSLSASSSSSRSSILTQPEVVPPTRRVVAGDSKMDGAQSSSDIHADEGDAEQVSGFRRSSAFHVPRDKNFVEADDGLTNAEKLAKAQVLTDQLKPLSNAAIRMNKIVNNLNLSACTKKELELVREKIDRISPEMYAPGTISIKLAPKVALASDVVRGELEARSLEGLSKENTQFLKAATAFRLQPGRVFAQRIMETFVGEGAPKQVNLSMDAVRKLRTAFEAACTAHDALTPAQEQKGVNPFKDLFEDAHVEMNKMVSDNLLGAFKKELHKAVKDLQDLPDPAPRPAPKKFLGLF